MLHEDAKVSWTFDSDEGVNLVDFIKLGKLTNNTVLLLTDGVNTFHMIVGSATPFHGPSNSDADEGWDYNKAKHFKVLKAGFVNLMFHDIPLSTEYFNSTTKLVSC